MLMMKAFYRLPLCVLLVCVLSACQSLSHFSQSLPHFNSHAAPTSVVIKKPPADTKQYRYLTLENGLKVLLIHDPKAQKAAVSLNVNVGSGADPRGREGLAHFLEHMLFLGTQKYPEPNGYQAFIQRHGGSYNAYTSYEHTNYFFDIQPEQFEQAFDRFAQFFIAPLFSPDLVERERKAVFSEYAARLKDEGRRSLDALKSVVNQQHPFAKFSVGSDKTLTSDKLRDDVIDFYNTYYSADIMALVVAANNSLDSLETMVKNHLTQVKRFTTPQWRSKVKLFEKNSLPALLQVKPEKTLRRLNLSFYIEPPRPYYRTKPLSYLAHVLGHEGKGSLLSELKRQDLATMISAGSGTSFTNEGTFVLSIGLTEKGEERWKHVVELAFSAISRIKSEPLNPNLYSDLAKIADLEYRYKNLNISLNQVMRYAANLHDYAPQDVVVGPYLYEGYNAVRIKAYLENLKPSNMLVTLTSKQVDTNRISPWFHTPYRFSSLSQNWIDGLAKQPLNPRIAIPSVNPFLPSDLTVNTPSDKSSIPTLIVNQNGVTFWYKQDAMFNQPKTQWIFSLISNSVSQSSSDYAANILHAHMLDDAIIELSYPALMAGLRFSVSAQKRGLLIRLSGYSDKQTLLMEQLVDKLAQSLENTARFETLRTELANYYRNQSQNAPYKIALRSLTNRLVTPSYNPQEISDALEQLTWEYFQRFNMGFWQNFEVEGLVNGNTTMADASTLLNKALRPLLKKRVGQAVDVAAISVEHLDKSDPIYLSIKSNHSDHAAIAYYQFSSGFESLAAASVSAKLVETQFYHKLRTLKQLGYVVFATPFNLKEQGGLAFVIQSPSVKPQSLVDEIKKFLDRFMIENFSTDEQKKALENAFWDVKNALKNELLTPAKSLREQTGRYWYDINHQHWQFNSRAKTLRALDTLTFEQWEKAFRRAVLGDASAIYVLSE